MNRALWGKLLALRLLPRPLRRAVMRRRWEEEMANSSEPEMTYLRHMLKPGDFAIDVGANLGGYTYELQRITGNVMAFEPNPHLASLIHSLGYDGARVRAIGLSARDGEATLSIPRFRSGHVLGSLKRSVAEAAGAKLEAYRVPTRRLDSLELPSVAFIKIDVEGFEEEVLTGGRKLIKRDQPVILIEVEERHNPGGLARIRERLSAYEGFFLHREAWHPLADFTSALQDEAELAPGRYATRREIPYVNNFLFVPKGRSFDFLPQQD